MKCEPVCDQSEWSQNLQHRLFFIKQCEISMSIQPKGFVFMFDVNNLQTPFFKGEFNFFPSQIMGASFVLRSLPQKIPKASFNGCSTTGRNRKKGQVINGVSNQCHQLHWINSVFHSTQIFLSHSHLVFSHSRFPDILNRMFFALRQVIHRLKRNPIP